MPVFYGTDSADSPSFDSYDYLYGGGGNDTLGSSIGGFDYWEGGAGNDYLFAIWNSNAFGNYYGGDGNDFIQMGNTATSEEAYGGSSNDRIEADPNGVASVDYMDGGSGRDSLSGYAGNDILLGGDGDESGSNITVGPGGSSFAPGLFGGAGNDYLDGGRGNDLLEGGAGADVLIGGIGTDTASFAGSTAGVFVRLDLGVGTLGDAEGDTYSGIENLLGSSQADILVGDINVNSVSGGGGNDQLTGGGGADTIDGGAGFDFTRYELATSGVTVRLDMGTGMAGDAAGDTYNSIEGVIGSEFNDVLVGSGTGNYLFGLGGNDYLYSFGGFDELYGGGGADAFVFRAADLPGAFATIRDYSAVENDGIVFEGVAAGTLQEFQSGSDVVFQLAGGAGGIVVANTTVDQLAGHVFFA